MKKNKLVVLAVAFVLAVGLKSVNVNALTITNPYLVDLVRRHFGNDFIIRVSSFACVDNYEKAKFWDKLGVDIICVDFCKVNRNFKMLKYMVNNLNCKIILNRINTIFGFIQNTFWSHYNLFSIYRFKFTTS